MTLVQQLCSVAIAFKEARRLSSGRVSTLVFGDGTKLTGLLSGRSDLTTSRFETAMRWFSANWPAGATWPSAVARPAPIEPERAA